jgi:hypothetical protein
VTPPADRILDTLRAAHSAQSTGAIADALDAPDGLVRRALVELEDAGRVVPVPASSPGEPLRWAIAAVAESPGETIRCTDYREHAISGHRRDPGTGRFRCYVCEPGPIPPALGDGRPAGVLATQWHTQGGSADG